MLAPVRRASTKLIAALVLALCPAASWAAPPEPEPATPAEPAPQGPAKPASAPEPKSEPKSSPLPRPAAKGSDAQAALSRNSGTDIVRKIFELPPSDRKDAYGPRPAGVPELTREQIVRYGLENPYISAADEHVESMRALLRKAKFAWVPQINASVVLTPGAAITCDDVTLTGVDGEFDYQYCRSTGDPIDGSDNVDIQRVKGYFERISQAGIAVRLQAETNIPITTFGKILSAQALAKVGVELAEIQKIATEQETILKVYQAHAALLLARESIAILEEAWKVIQTERGQIEQDLGLLPGGASDFDADPGTLNIERDPDDLTRLELGEIELAGRMGEARLIEARALATLWAIAGKAAPEGFDIKEERLMLDPIPGGLDELDHYQATARKNRPEARLADAGVKARKVQEKLARRSFLPDLGAIVRLGYGYANKADPDMRTLYYMGRLNYSQIYFGLGLAWSLDFHNDAFALQKARAERREAEYLREAARSLLALEVEQAYREVLDAEQRIAFAELARDRSWKRVVSEQTSSSIGAGDFDDMGKALSAWAEYEFSYFEAVMIRNVAVAKLGRATGTSLTAP